MKFKFSASRDKGTHIALTLFFSLVHSIAVVYIGGVKALCWIPEPQVKK